ncbi:MAG: antitoxin family protein [Anaerolineae bacterium]|nr:antitoxin family protein [Anaerolineae bacterium]
MSLVIRAIYEDGVFRPLQRVRLPTRQVVRLKVISEKRVAPRDRLQELIDSGVVKLADFRDALKDVPEPTMTLEEFHASLPPISIPIEEMIREEREERDARLCA